MTHHSCVQCQNHEQVDQTPSYLTKEISKFGLNLSKGSHMNSLKHLSRSCTPQWNFLCGHWKSPWVLPVHVGGPYSVPRINYSCVGKDHFPILQYVLSPSFHLWSFIHHHLYPEIQRLTWVLFPVIDLANKLLACNSPFHLVDCCSQARTNIPLAIRYLSLLFIHNQGIIILRDTLNASQSVSWEQVCSWSVFQPFPWRLS